MYFIDYKKMYKYSKLIYAVAIFINVSSLFMGSTVNGKSYFYICGGIYFAPAVLTLPLYVISFCGLIENINQESNIKIKYLHDKTVNILELTILSLISLISLAPIPDLTSAGILCLTYLILATIKIVTIKQNVARNILKLWTIFLGFALLFLLYEIGFDTPYRGEKITAFLHLESYTEGIGWLQMQRSIIINSSVTFGKAGDMSNIIDLIDEGTNYAFISILAHYGWIPSLIIAMIILACCVRLIIDAIKVKDNYGKLLIIGLSSLFILQSIFNILMNLNLWIELNFNLPFVSYGAQNLIINILSLALILSVYRRKDIYLYENV